MCFAFPGTYLSMPWIDSKFRLYLDILCGILLYENKQRVVVAILRCQNSNRLILVYCEFTLYGRFDCRFLTKYAKRSRALQRVRCIFVYLQDPKCPHSMHLPMSESWNRPYTIFCLSLRDTFLSFELLNRLPFYEEGRCFLSVRKNLSRWNDVPCGKKKLIWNKMIRVWFHHVSAMLYCVTPGWLNVFFPQFRRRPNKFVHCHDTSHQLSVFLWNLTWMITQINRSFGEILVEFGDALEKSDLEVTISMTGPIVHVHDLLSNPWPWFWMSLSNITIAISSKWLLWSTRIHSERNRLDDMFD